MRDTLSLPSAAYVRTLLDYDPEAGVFRWRLSRGRVAAGSVTGSMTRGGSLVIRLDATNHPAHRLAWLYMTGHWPDQQIRHRDGNPANNRWLNLTQDSRYGEPSGVSFDATTGVYAAHINVGGQQWHLGDFPTAVAAEQSYIDARRLFIEG